jgi:predicted nucleic acid-binding protein
MCPGETAPRLRASKIAAMRLYLDTSVLGAVLDREDPRRVTSSRTLLESIGAQSHAGVISNIVQEELEQAPDSVRDEILAAIFDIEFELVIESDESKSLFSEYETLGVVPPRYRNDLRHVAVASASHVDALVSWNFRHLVNVRTRRAVNSVNLRLGYPLIEIVSPEEV